MANPQPENGWIKLHRKIRESPKWYSEKFTKQQAWIDLLLMANHKEKTFYIRDNEINVLRGQVARSQDVLAISWKWSRGKVKRFLNTLKMEQQIDIKKSHIISIVTILNYDQYQSNDTTDGRQTVDRRSTDGHKQECIRKNKNEKNKEYSAEFLEFTSKYPGKINKAYAWECWQRKAKVRPALENILTAIDYQIEEKAQKKANGEWVPEWKLASTWINQQCWEDEIQIIKRQKNTFLEGLGD